MKLSVLDQSPVMIDATGRDALNASLELAVQAEKLGFIRYWIAEHHGMEQLASSVPEVMLSYIGTQTSHIKIGSGAILLPHYKPYKVAEIFNLLETLFPNRIDLGIGRAPGGSAEASIALSGNYLENVKKMPQLTEDLLHFIQNDFPENNMFSKLAVLPQPNHAPKVWLLGTSEKSAKQAAKLGMGYAFGHFMSDNQSSSIINSYRKEFIPSNIFDNPYCIITVNVICSDTNEKAEEIAMESILTKINENHTQSYLDKEDKLRVKQMREKMVVGNPTKVKEQLFEIKDKNQADEIMIVTITNSYETRLRSYELIANEVFS